MLMMAPIQVIVGVSVLGGFVIALTRYVSLAVLAMFGLFTLWMLILIGQRLLPVEYVYYALLVTAMMLYRFRENIQRLIAGKERRLGERA
jgi:glycerol-3-phosphate acyltransferase PlsY